MKRANDAGVYQLENGNWAYRVTWRENGKKVNRKGTKDEFGNPLTTKRKAIQARNQILYQKEQPIMPKKEKPMQLSKNRIVFGAII